MTNHNLSTVESTESSFSAAIATTTSWLGALPPIL
jgi:hypothetical protein